MDQRSQGGGEFFVGHHGNISAGLRPMPMRWMVRPNRGCNRDPIVCYRQQRVLLSRKWICSGRPGNLQRNRVGTVRITDLPCNLHWMSGVGDIDDCWCAGTTSDGNFIAGTSGKLQRIGIGDVLVWVDDADRLDKTCIVLAIL